ncbi:MAG: hypothetical protein ABIT58_06980 [Ferruginibacter sp.]
MKLVLTLFSFVFVLHSFSQNCEVSLASIQGKYTGACKNNKADGVGRSEGTDSYDGFFKSGLPSGSGTYTYKNGDYFVGDFKKGIKEGAGEFHYKKTASEDSIVKGYWKNDVYAGLFSKPYVILTKTADFNKLEIKKGVGQPNTITIVSENTIKMNSLTNSIPPIPVIDQITAEEGTYSREERTVKDKKAVLVLHDVTFPLRFKVVYHSDSFEAVIYKPGNWEIQAQISARD